MKQTVEARFDKMCLRAIRTNPDFFIDVEMIWKFMQQELKANDDKWREKIAGFPKKMEFNPETDNLEIDIIKAYKFFTNLKKNKLIIY